jgi:hypothetical protein
MGRAKEIIVKVIPAKIANPFVQKHHYSGKVVPNSNLHFGAFLDGKLHGVLSYGPSMRKDKTIGLVEGTTWGGFLELNRMAFDDYLPKNSESFCIAKTLRMIKKQAPQIKWVVSYADGTQCGDGTIYRASNFVLTGIKENHAIYRLPNGTTICQMTIIAHPDAQELKDACKSLGVPLKNYKASEWLAMGAELIRGFQLRYIYFIDPKWRKRLTVPEIPFSKIDEMGAGMYKGENVTQESRHVKCEAQLEREAKKKE